MFEWHIEKSIRKLHQFYGCTGIKDLETFFKKIKMQKTAETINKCHQQMH